MKETFIVIVVVFAASLLGTFLLSIVAARREFERGRGYRRTHL
jgi:hypothetical protein